MKNAALLAILATVLLSGTGHAQTAPPPNVGECLDVSQEWTAPDLLTITNSSAAPLIGLQWATNPGPRPDLTYSVRDAASGPDLNAVWQQWEAQRGPLLPGEVAQISVQTSSTKPLRVDVSLLPPICAGYVGTLQPLPPVPPSVTKTQAVCSATGCTPATTGQVQVRACDTLRYTITAQQGSTTTHAARIVDTLPAGLNVYAVQVATPTGGPGLVRLDGGAWQTIPSNTTTRATGQRVEVAAQWYGSNPAPLSPWETLTATIYAQVAGHNCPAPTIQ